MAPSVGSAGRRASSLSARVSHRAGSRVLSGFDRIAVIDQANQDYVSGWAVHADGVMKIEVFVENRFVGCAEYGAYRLDVAQHLVDNPDAASSGFAYLFSPGDLAEAGKAVVSVHVVCHSLSGETCTSFPVEIPTARLPSRYAAGEGEAPSVSAYPSPFPREVEEVLRRLRGAGVDADEPWTPGRVDAAIDDLILAAEVVSRDTAGLYRYFSYLREIWTRIEFNSGYFPAMNRTATEGRKDARCVATGPDELFVMCHHLATLRSHAVPGNVCEFGCFKGFSTAVLSEACFRLGMTLDVFDSFAGLPPSDSEIYEAGEFMGSLPEVRANVLEFGRLESVRFHEGFFSETVDLYDRDRIACLWMDVDLELSARDAMHLFPRLDPRSCVFSDECEPEDFLAGEIVESPSPDRVIEPICDAFRQDGRSVQGHFVAGHTGCFRDRKLGIPVLASGPLLRLKDALLG